MWVALSIFILLILGFIPFISICNDALADYIHAKADEIHARAEKIRHDISNEENEKG